MRVRNRELNKRWHRKEQRIKELRKLAMEGGKVEKAPKPAKKAAAPKATAAKSESEKPKKAPAKKKAEPKTESAE